MKKNTMILINLLCFIGIFILTVLFFTNTTTAIMVNYLDYERWLYSAGFLLGIVILSKSRYVSYVA